MNKAPLPLLLLLSLSMYFSNRSVAQGSCEKVEKTPTGQFGFRATQTSDVPVTDITASNSNGTGWAGAGNGTVNTGDISTVFEDNNNTQTFTLPINEANPRTDGAVVTLKLGVVPDGKVSELILSFAGTRYAIIATNGDGSRGVTRSFENGAISSSNININGEVTTSITLPADIPNTGSLEVSFDPGGSDAEDGSDNLVVYEMSFKSCRSASSATPVTFGSFDAYIKSDVLHVNWQTLQEENVSHFEIETSVDGHNFYQISIVKTKAKDGRSDMPIHYNETVSLNGIAIMGLSLFLLSMGLMLRRKIWLGVVLLSIGAGSLLYSCSRSDSEFHENAAEKVYVRITQVDKDGTTNRTKVIKAGIYEN